MNRIKLKHAIEPGSLKTGPFGSDLKTSSYSETGSYRVYTQENVIANDFTIGSAFIDFEKFRQLKSCAVNRGDILVSTRGTIGVFSQVPNNNFQEGILHSSVIKFAFKPNFCSNFYKYVLNSLQSVRDYIAINTAKSSVPALYSGDLKEIPIPNPSYEEQIHIAAYLDEKTAAIDANIEAKKNLRSTLLAYRARVVTEGVSNGFNPGPTKKSGVSWVPEIPKNWKITRLSEVIGTIVTGKEDASFASEEGEYSFYTCRKEPLKCNSAVFEGPAILMAGNGDFSNIKHISSFEKFNAYQRVYVIKHTKIDMRYMYYCLSGNFPEFVKTSQKGSVIEFIVLSDILRFKVPVPSPEEQIAIAKILDEKTSKIDELITLIDKQVVNLTNYRSAVIREAVQGRSP